MSMAWTQADIVALETAIKGGVLAVEYDGPPRRRVEYQSLDMMRRLLAEMRGDVAKQSGAKSYRLAAFSKGF